MKLKKYFNHIYHSLEIYAVSFAELKIFGNYFTKKNGLKKPVLYNFNVVY